MGAQQSVPSAHFEGLRMKERRRAVKGTGHWRETEGGFIFRKSVGYKADGHRKVLTVSAKTKTAAIKLMKEKERKWEQESMLFMFRDTMTFSDFMNWHLTRAKGYLKPRSYDRLEGTIINQITKYPIGHQQIVAMLPEDFDRHFAQLVDSGVSMSSIKKVYDAINDAYRYAIMNDKIRKNPMSIDMRTIQSLVDERDKLKYLKDNPDKQIEDYFMDKAKLADVEYLEDDEIIKLRQVCLEKNPRTGKTLNAMGLPGLFLLYTGARCGEVACLLWKDYDPVEKTLSIYKTHGITKNREGGEKKTKRVIGYTKNKKVRKIRLSDDAVDILKRMMQETDFYGPNQLIFPTKNGKHNTATNMEHCFARIEKKAEISKTTGALHVLRKTFATKMYRQGAKIEEIAAYIGDEPDTVRRYYIGMKDKDGTVTVELGNKAALEIL